MVMMSKKTGLMVVTSFAAFIFSTVAMAEFKCEDIKDKATKASCISTRDAKLIADENAKENMEKKRQDALYAVFETANATCFRMD